MLLNYSRHNIRRYVYITGGWWHLNWGGRARGNGWSRISGMVSNTSNIWFPFVWFHSLHCRDYYELSSPHQPPLVYTIGHSLVMMLWLCSCWGQRRWRCWCVGAQSWTWAPYREQLSTRATAKLTSQYGKGHAHKHPVHPIYTTMHTFFIFHLASKPWSCCEVENIQYHKAYSNKPLWHTHAVL